MDISEKRIPQDGRIQIKSGADNIDLRISTLPTIFGEKVGIRLLDKSNVMYSVRELGMDAEIEKKFDDTLRQIARIAYDPLCACPACEKQAQADNHCYSCSHVTLDFSGCYSSVGCPGCGFTRT